MKIEALRTKLGDSYLSVVGEQGWSSGSTVLSNAALDSLTLLQTPNGSNSMQGIHPVHETRHFGQPLSP